MIIVTAIHICIDFGATAEFNNIFSVTCFFPFQSFSSLWQFKHTKWTTAHYLLVQIIPFVFCFEILLDPYRNIDWQILRDFSKLLLKKNKVNYIWEGFTGGSNDKEHACQSCRRCKRGRFHLWVRMIPWRRKWQLTPVFLPGEFHGQGSLVG